MRRTEARQGVRMMTFRGVLDRYEAAEFNQMEAAELLGISERTFRRWCHRYEEAGEAGLLDRRLGQASGRRVPLDREQEVETPYRTRYSGFTARHFHDILWASMASAGVTPGPRASCNRKACWHERPGVARIGASGRVGRCRE